tara:strand:+ start:1788 stop:2081 length:294 start_codon:yes stop_codon:yes gene_type:complete
MAESDRRKKNADESTVDLNKFLTAKNKFILSADEVFKHFDWGCKWSDLPMGVLDNMTEAYEQMVLSEAQKEKAFTASSFSDDWKSTTHSNYYDSDPA